MNRSSLLELLQRYLQPLPNPPIPRLGHLALGKGEREGENEWERERDYPFSLFTLPPSLADFLLLQEIS